MRHMHCELPSHSGWLCFTCVKAGEMHNILRSCGAGPAIRQCCYSFTGQLSSRRARPNNPIKPLAVGLRAINMDTTFPTAG